jgi:hypothetical protein
LRYSLFRLNNLYDNKGANPRNKEMFASNFVNKIFATVPLFLSGHEIYQRKNWLPKVFIRIGCGSTTTTFNRRITNHQIHHLCYSVPKCLCLYLVCLQRNNIVLYYSPINLVYFDVRFSRSLAKSNITDVRFRGFTEVTMKNAVFWDIKTQFVLHRRHITSPLQSQVGECYVRLRFSRH